MDYIYDIVLNFQSNYYDFFEWKQNDKIINIKKIPVYSINNENYLNLKYNDVILDIKNIPKQIKMFLVTNGIEVMGILIDNKGRVIKRSSLIFDEADEVLEEKDSIKPLSIKYKKNIKKNYKLNKDDGKIKFNNVELPILKGDIIGKITYDIDGTKYTSNLLAENSIQNETAVNDVKVVIEKSNNAIAIFILSTLVFVAILVIILFIIVIRKERKLKLSIYNENAQI